MAKPQAGTRVTLQLDPRLALEAILLNRLARLPASRRQEWLRSLLVQGFRSECQALRGVPQDPTRRPTMAFTPRQAGGCQRSANPKPAVLPARAPAGTRGAKPFVALGKVIG
jgi:hypothetical protein